VIALLFTLILVTVLLTICAVLYYGEEQFNAYTMEER